MKDVPDSGSDSEENLDSFQGLTKAAIYVGEGPVLYLQIVKTLGVMCTILSIINMPLYLMYSTAANSRVNFLNVNSVFQHFSLGYIGTTIQICQTSHIPYEAGKSLYPNFGEIATNVGNIPRYPPKKMHYKCPLEDGYFKSLDNFGFLYKIDMDFKTYSSGDSRCQKINPDY
jgi:hypothetical protein